MVDCRKTRPLTNLTFSNARRSTSPGASRADQPTQLSQGLGRRRRCAWPAETLPGLAHALPAEPIPRPKRPVERAKASLNILILGGTGFTGPEQVEYAIARGHHVTLFNRNKTRPDFFKGKVAELIGDLNEDMSALKGKKFDVVIDNPTTVPAWVRNAAQYLAGNTNHYIFISTISVYRERQERRTPTRPSRRRRCRRISTRTRSTVRTLESSIGRSRRTPRRKSKNSIPASTRSFGPD